MVFCGSIGIMEMDCISIQFQITRSIFIEQKNERRTVFGQKMRLDLPFLFVRLSVFVLHLHLVIILNHSLTFLMLEST